MADAMYAPVCARFTTYDVPLDPVCDAYRKTIMTMPLMSEWIDAAKIEPDEVEGAGRRVLAWSCRGACEMRPEKCPIAQSENPAALRG